MERKKSAIIFFILIFLVSWLLISSLSNVHVENVRTTGSSGTGSGSGSGSSTGSGSGSGSASNLSSIGGLNLNGLNLFNFNFSFKGITGIINNLKFPTISLKLPNFNIPSVGSSANLGGGSGLSNDISNVVNLIHINKYIIIFIFIVISVVILVYTIISRNKVRSGKKRTQSYALMEDSIPDNQILEERIETIPVKNDEIKTVKNDLTLKSIPLKGWGEALIMDFTEIPNDLPLIWDYETALKIKTPEGTQLKIYGKENSEEVISGVCKIGIGKNRFHAIFNEKRDEKIVIGTKYENEIRDTLLVNLESNINEEIANKTVREILRINDDSKILIEIFERTVYGKKKIDRTTYEKFLHKIKTVFSNPRIPFRED